MNERARGRAVGVDYGTKRVGIAVADPLNLFAQPVGTFDPSGAIEAITKIDRESGVSVLVVGWPLQEDGSEGVATERVAQYINRLRKALPLADIHQQDERYTSVEALERMREQPRRRGTARARLDTAAAGLILQEYLDAKAG